MARTRKQTSRGSPLTLPPIGLNRRSTEVLPSDTRCSSEVRLPYVSCTSVRLESPVPKILSTRYGPLELLSEKFLVSGRVATNVNLEKRPLRRCKSRRRLQDLKIGDLRQSVWNFDKKDVLRRKRSRSGEVKPREKQDGTSLSPGFDTGDYIETLLSGRFSPYLDNFPHTDYSGRQMGKNKLPVLHSVTDVSSSTEFHGQNTKQQFSSVHQVHDLNVTSVAFQKGLTAPVNSPVFDPATAFQKHKQLPPLATQQTTTQTNSNTSLSSNHLIFQPWEEQCNSSRQRLLPPIVESAMNSQPASTTDPPSQTMSSAPVIDLNVQFTRLGGSKQYDVCEQLGIMQNPTITSQKGLVPLLPSVAGHGLKAVKATDLRKAEHSNQDVSKQTLSLELQATSGNFSVIGVRQKLDGGLKSNDNTPVSGVLAPDNSNASEHSPPLSACVLHQSVHKRLAALPLQLFRYFPLSTADDEHHPTAHQALQLDEDTDSGRQSSSDYESGPEQPTTPEYPSLAMVTFRVSSRGELSLSPTGRCPIQITVRSQRAVKKLVSAAMAVSRNQQRVARAQYRAQQRGTMTLDGTDLTSVPKARAVIAVSRKQKRVNRPQATTVKEDHGKVIATTEDHFQKEKESVEDVISFPTNLFDVPTDVVDASADLGKYLDAAGFPPGSAVFVPPTGEPLVLTPEGGVVALPSQFELSNSEQLGHHTVVQSNMSGGQEIDQAGILESLDFAFGQQKSTYSDSGVYESSHHILHNTPLEPILASPQTSARAREFESLLTTAPSHDSSGASAETKKDFEALVTGVSFKGVQDAIDQLKQSSKESSIERNDGEPVLTEEEKLKLWQEEFRTMAVQKMEEEWEKYKQHKLQQEQERLKDKEKAANEELDKSQMTSTRLDVVHGFEVPSIMLKKSQSAELIGSAYDQSGTDVELESHHINMAIKPRGDVSTKVAYNDDEDEENTSEVEAKERSASPPSSNISYAAAGMEPGHVTSQFQSSIAAQANEPRDEIRTLTAGRTKKLTKKRSSLHKPAEVSTPKGKAQPELVKSRKKSRGKSSKGVTAVQNEVNNKQKQIPQAKPQHLAENQGEAKVTAGRASGKVPKKDKVNKVNSIDGKQNDDRVAGSPVEGPPNIKVSAHDTAAVLTDAGAESSEALDELTVLPSDIGASAVLTDGYDSEANLQERRLSRVEKRNLAAERRRQEVEKKRLEQKEAKRRAAEEEARIEEMRRQAEEKLQQQIAEKRRKLREEREAKEQAEREARERHQTEMRKNEMMQRQVEEMKKRVHEEIARRRQEEEMLLEAQHLAAEEEAKRKREIEERRLMWEKMLQEEQDEKKRLEMEEQRRHEEEEARLLEEKRRQSAEEEKERLHRLEMQKARAVAQKQWHGQTVLEALNLVFALRLNQEFTYSYFTFLPYDSLL